MKSSKRGRTISASVEGITPFGLWLLVQGKEHFLSFEEYPCFKEQPAKAVRNVQLLHGYHLRWPDLDIDLETDNLDHPECYPLKSLKAVRPPPRVRKTATRPAQDSETR